MKEGVYGLNKWKFPFILLILVCMTIVLGWQRAPFFTSIIVIRRQFFRISPDFSSETPVTSLPPQAEILVADHPITLKEDERHNNIEGPAVVAEVKDISENSSQQVSSRGTVPSVNENGSGSDDKTMVAPVSVSSPRIISMPVSKEKKESIATEDKKQYVSSGTPVTSLAPQQEMLMADHQTTLKGDEMHNKFEGPAVVAEVKDMFVNSSLQVSSRGTAPSVNDIGSGSDDKTIGVPVSVSSPRISSIPLSKEKKESIATEEKKQSCNYARGNWVSDNRRPFYSGNSCKQWLSGMWACRLTQRTDFSYEKFRWQPFDCEMEEFAASKFLEKMRHKTLAFIGDSLGRQQFQSLMCMLTSGKQRPDVVNVGWEYGLVKGRRAVRPDGWAHRFPSTNTTILFYWSSCLCDLEPLNNTNYAMHLDRPPAFLRRYINRFDVLVLNTGHHWNRGKIEGNRWIMYVDGKLNTNSKIADMNGAKNLTAFSVTRWVDSQLQRYPKLKPFFRSMSPRHFFNGDWNTGGTCDNTNPLSKGMRVLQKESSDLVSAMAVKGTKVNLLDITAISSLRDEAHISRYSIKNTPGVQDCLHWCLPGIPDTWNELLFAQI